jgi:L-amino acid N-acyltransferase YncA
MRKKKTYRIIKTQNYYYLQRKAIFGWYTLDVSWRWKWAKDYYRGGYPFSSAEQAEREIPGYEVIKTIIRHKIIKVIEN